MRLSLDATNLMPENAWAHRRAELIAGRMRERSIDLPEDVRRKMNFSGAKWTAIQDERSFSLGIAPRDLWDVDAVLEAPRTAMKGAIFIAVLIAVVWGYIYYQEHLRRRTIEDDKQAGLKEDLRQLNSHRSRLKPKS
jgi:hypothetical protein